MAKSQKHTVDFQTANETDLHNIVMPLNFTMQQSGNIHGLAFWFDVAFIGSQYATTPPYPKIIFFQMNFHEYAGVLFQSDRLAVDGSYSAPHSLVPSAVYASRTAISQTGTDLARQSSSACQFKVSQLFIATD